MTCTPDSRPLESAPAKDPRLEPGRLVGPSDFPGLVDQIRADVASWPALEPHEDPLLREYRDLARWGLVDPETLPR